MFWAQWWAQWSYACEQKSEGDALLLLPPANAY